MTPALSMKKAPFWKRWMGRFLTEHIPSRIKRLLFLSSIIGLLEKLETPDQQLLNKLNEVLKLAHNNDALALPFHIRSWLWKECDFSTALMVNGQPISVLNIAEAKLNKSDFLRFAEFLISKAPEWIVYGSDQTIAKDLELVIRNMNTLHHQ